MLQGPILPPQIKQVHTGPRKENEQTHGDGQPRKELFVSHEGI